MDRFFFVGFFLLLAQPASAQDQVVVLTLGEALERARESAPPIVAARLGVEEARARIIGAAIPFSANPTLDAQAGRRSGATSSTDYGVEIAQDFDLPQARRSRMDAVRASLSREEHRALDVERNVLREVAILFLRAVEARERSEAASTGKRLADETLRIAERRYQEGDVAQLDVNLVRTAVARADLEARASAATAGGYLSQLQIHLGMTSPVNVEGSLGDPMMPSTTALVAQAVDRPDARILEAEISEAEAEQRLARLFRWPDFGLRASYSREEGDRIVLGGVGISVPVFNRGQEASAVAKARLARLRAERDALVRAIETEVRGAVLSYDALRAATDEYQRTVLPLIEQNERLALESYEVGQIGLGDLLLVRREALDARRGYIDQLIETRLAEVELRLRTGVWK